MAEMLNVFYLLFCTVIIVSMVGICQSLQNIQKLEQYRLVECINNVVDSYFTKGLPILLSLPDEIERSSVSSFKNLLPRNDDSHIIQVFIKTIYEEHNWSVVLEGPEEEFGNVLLEPKRQINANYLLIIPFISNLDEMEHYGFQQLLNLMHTQIWNPRGNYIIVSRSSLKSAEEFALYVLNKLWYDYKILNLFILFTDLEEDMHDTLKIETYTWIPQQTKKECLIPKDVVLAQRCEIKNANNYINSDSRIRNKIPINFNKCPIIVATPLRDYFWETNENNETVLLFDEADMVVLDIILKHLNMTRLTQVYPKTSNLRTSSVRALISASTGVADVALGHIAILAQIQKFCESSVPYLFTHTYKWFVPCGRNSSRLRSMGRIFTFSFLLVLMVTILLTIVVMVFLASVGNHRKSEFSNYTFFSNCSEYAWAVLLGVSVPKLPKSLKLRYFFISFVWFSYGVNMVFQIYFTSYLTEPGLEHVVEDYTELVQSGLNILYASNLYYYLNSSLDKRDTEILKRSVPSRDPNYCFNRVDKTESFAYLGIQLDARWYCHSHINRRMCILPDGAFVFMLAMHFPKGSYYIESFNRLLYFIIEAGLPEKIEDTKIQNIVDERSDTAYWKDYSNITYEDYGGNDYITFSLLHMELSFIFILFGYLISTVVFVLEILNRHLGRN